ncbi:MAG: AraC family transcriptional regulator [Bacteroidaceae bacterium]|nr:AraC family transcriptional regulator [Bacteroidaceae bacterium]
MTESTPDKEKVEHYKYLQISPRDKSWGLAVTTAGFQHVRPGDSYPLSLHPSGYTFQENGRRVLNEYQLYYITHGSGYFESASCSRTRIEPGMMFMLFPGEWHSFAPDPETGWNDHWVGFNGSFMDDKIKAGFFTFKNCVFKVGVDEKITNTYLEVLDILSEEKKAFQQIAASLVISLIGRIHYKDLNHNNGETYITRIINQSKAIMKEDFASNTPLGQIAQSLGISYSLFRREFKNRCGISPGQYRLELRLVKAKEMLHTTNMSIADISSRLHFECIGQFSTFFKKKTGLSPLEYRKRDANKN